MGSFHAAWACPCWVFPHWLDSAQHPIPQGDGAYEFIIIIGGYMWIEHEYEQLGLGCSDADVEFCPDLRQLL